MGRAARWALLLAVAAAQGCAAKRPYAGHPLLRDGRGVWGDPERGRSPPPPPAAPEPPPPPAVPDSRPSTA
jgi:hypothetical protein